MRYCFYISACLFLIIFQTAIMPYLPLFNKLYDLLIPFIIWLSIYRPVREGLAIVFLLGFIMDNLSGSPFGLYLTTYFWLFVGVRWIKKYLRVANMLLLSLIVITGVLLENFLFMGTFAIFGTGRQFTAEAAKIIAAQVVWAVCTGPLFLVILINIHKRLDAQWINI